MFLSDYKTLLSPADHGAPVWEPPRTRAEKVIPAGRSLEPPVRNQGRPNDCQSFAAVRLAQIAQARDGMKRLDLSPRYVYWYLRAAKKQTSQDAGGSLFEALDMMRVGGCCLESQYPYDPNRLRSGPKCPETYVEGLKHRVVAFSPLRFLKMDGSVDVEVLKQAILHSSAFAFAIAVFGTLALDGQGMVQVPTTAEQKSLRLFGHALVAVDYDASRKAFYVANSWGTSWGLAGHCWLPEAYFLAGLAAEAWVIDAMAG